MEGVACPLPRDGGEPSRVAGTRAGPGWVKGAGKLATSDQKWQQFGPTLLHRLPAGLGAQASQTVPQQAGRRWRGEIVSMRTFCSRARITNRNKYNKRLNDPQY